MSPLEKYAQYVGVDPDRPGSVRMGRPDGRAGSIGGATSLINFYRFPDFSIQNKTASNPPIQTCRSNAMNSGGSTQRRISLLAIVNKYAFPSGLSNRETSRIKTGYSLLLML